MAIAILAIHNVSLYHTQTNQLGHNNISKGYKYLLSYMKYIKGLASRVAVFFIQSFIQTGTERQLQIFF